MEVSAISAFDYTQYMPHGMCYMWRPEVLWSSVAADVITSLAYLAFALAIVRFIHKRTDLPYPLFFLLSGSIVFLACGASHFMSAVVIWIPAYAHFAVLKALVAITSVAAAAFLWLLLPVFLALPSPTMLRVKNQQLEQEIDIRKQKEEKIKRLNTSLREARDDAELATESRTQFLSTMSHEIRTPMNGVLGVLELLELSELDELQKKHVRIMKRSGSTLMTVINDILDFSKIEAGKLELETISFDIQQLLEETASPYKSKDTGDLKLEIRLDKNIPLNLKGDPTRLHQIFTNLLNNAYKFTDKGTITLSAELLEDLQQRIKIRFSLSDTGIGMPADVVDNLFQPYAQADKSTARKYGGTGLGLSICKQLVEMMGGQIAVDSECGQGSTFHFNLTLAVDAEATQSTATAKERTQDFSGIRVLLADDNKVNQMVAIGLMGKLGVKPDVVANGAEAVDLICKQQQHYHLILMDCEMPIMDGYEATQAIRKYEQRQSASTHSIIYAISAHVMSEHKDKCHEAGMDDQLSKPITLKQLVAVFEKLSPATKS